MFIGEMVDGSVDENIRPLVYHDGKYWKIGERILKPSQETLDKIQKLIEKHRKNENKNI